MKLAVLFSGGKDSTLALHYALKKHRVKYLVSIFSQNPESYMYHTENIKLVEEQAKALQIPLIPRESSGEKEKELEDLKFALQEIREEIKGVVVGAVESKYQYSRVNSLAKELELEVFAPLWKKDPEKLLRNLIDLGYEAIITAVKAEGFSKEWLGRKIDKDCLKDLLKLREKYGIHLMGEGGEYETFVTDGPIFKKKIEILKEKKKWNKLGGELEMKEVKLVEKRDYI